MIEIFQDKLAHQQAFVEFGKLRKADFVDKKGWNVPVFEGLDVEYDWFDTLDACYVVYRDRSGNVRGGCRMLSTMQPYMLETIFPHMISGPMPKSPAIWENTRLVIDESISIEEQSIVFSELNIAGLEWLIDRGVTNTIMMTTVQLAEFGMSGKAPIELIPIGPETVIDGVPHVAIRTETLTQEVIDRLRKGASIWWPLHNRWEDSKAA